MSGDASAMRKMSSNNRTRNNCPNGTLTSTSFLGLTILTESDAVTDDNLFGPAVPGKLNFKKSEINSAVVVRDGVS